jgi:hypothetical protein
MVAMAERFHAEINQLARFRFDRSAASMAFVSALESENCLCLALDCGGVKGALLAQVMPFPLSREVIAKEIVFWIEREQRGRFASQMVHAFEAWAASKGAVAAGLSCFADGRTHRLFERAGYGPFETSMIKDL